MQGRNGYTSLRIAPLFSYVFFKVVGVLILANLKPTKTRFSTVRVSCSGPKPAEGNEISSVFGKTFKEPIAWEGLIVINKNEELELAFRELLDNSFVKNADR